MKCPVKELKEIAMMNIMGIPSSALSNNLIR